jgi:hypothetical protein
MHNSASLRGQAARLFDYLQSRTEPVDSDQIRRDLVVANISKLATSINAHLAGQGVRDRVVCLHRGRLPAWWSLMSVADARFAGESLIAHADALDAALGLVSTAGGDA